MVARRPRTEPRSEADALRLRLSRDLGWSPERGAGREVEVEGRRFRVAPLAEGPGAVALWCEPLGAAALPAYAVRRLLRAELRRHFTRPLVVVTDAAHAEQVWSWETREPGGPVAAHEVGRRAEAPWSEWLDRLRGIARSLGEPPCGAGAEVHAGAAAAVLGALVRRVRPKVPPAARPHLPGPLDDPAAAGQRVQDCVEAIDDPVVLRAWWRALTGLTVLDPACGTGGWLLGAMRALEPVYDACLDRMQGCVEEGERSRTGSARHADLRALVERAGESRRRFVVESIVLRTLYGADRDPDALRSAERALLGRSRATGAREDDPAPTHLREGDLEAGFATAGALLDGLRGAGEPAARGAALLEEAATLDRAEQRLVELRLVHGAPAAGVRAAWKEVDRRRTELAARADLPLLVAAGVDRADPTAVEAWRRAHRPLHPCLEHAGPLGRGGFSVRRAAGR